MRIRGSIIKQMIEHARRDAPVEACGYLAQKDEVVITAFRMKNADASPEHFSFEPAEQFAAVRQMRADGARLCGVYHSHPATAARLSQEDIRLANDPSLTYVIVSLAGPAPDVKAFRIRDGQAASEPLNVIED
jgi:proteasome lid subunit RPN8/RPN11